MSLLLDPLRSAAAAHRSAIRWSATVLGAEDSSVLDELGAHDVLPTASIGKVFLLVTVVDGVQRGVIDPEERLPVDARDRVSDSGLLQFLGGQSLSVMDLCRFVGALSDNLATNVLLRRVGLDSVTAMTARLGVDRSALHDAVRDARGAEHPPFLSTGCGTELATLMHGLASGAVVSPPVSEGVVELLRLNTDLSMVAAGFGLDPLAHVDEDLGVRLFNKTGTQRGTRADIGWVERMGRGSGLAYAVIARFEDSAPVRRAVLDAMRAVGEGIGALGGR